MTTEGQYIEALKRADAAGNTEDAQRLAQAIQRMRGQGVPFSGTGRDVGADVRSGAATVTYPNSQYADIEPYLSNRGAPARVRKAVGGARIEQDRLATLRRFYPDAVPYNKNGNANYVFTDPETGRPTLYNPRSLDAGDFASVIPEAIEATGAAIGAAIGAPAGPPGMAIGAGIGGSLSSEAEQAQSVLMGERVDTRGIVQRFTDPLLSFGMNAAGQRLGDVLAGPVRIGAGQQANALQLAQRNALQRRADDFAALGVPNPPAGALTDSRAGRMIEGTLAGTPGGADVIGGAYDTAQDMLGRAATSLAGRYGRNQSTAETGAAVQRGIADAAGRVRDRQADLYSRIYAAVPDQPLDAAALPQTTGLMRELLGGLARAPNSRGRALSPAIERADNLMQDIEAGNLDFATLRAIRTELGRDLENPLLLGAANSADPSLRRLYGAISQDMSAVAARSGQQRQLAVADRYTRAQASRMDRLNALVDAKTPERAMQMAMSGTKDGATNLVRLRRTLRPDEWGDVSSWVLGRMGRAKAGSQGANELGQTAADETWSAATFLTNWNNLSNDAKNALFRGTEHQELVPELNRLLRSAGRIKDAAKLNYPAGGQRAGYQLMGTATAGAAGALLSGDLTTGLAIGALSYLGPRVASRLLTNPTFVRNLAGAIHMTGDYGGKPALRIASRMAAVMEAEPEIREEITAYLDALRNYDTRATSPAPLALQSPAERAAQIRAGREQ